ncbi:MAG: ATPase [Anaerolineales bacterium]|nr:MAG: ATPase [Anaerolineales bacterium]
MVEIEIQHLVDRLESLLNESWLIPLTSNRIINEEEYLDIIDQMRITIPAGIKQAKRIQQERERIIAQAQEEAERIVTLAREQAANLTNEHEVLKTAETKAEALLKQAQQQAEDIKAGADDYAVEVLSELEEQLMVFLTTVRNGLKAVQRERGRREDASDSQTRQF